MPCFGTQRIHLALADSEWLAHEASPTQLLAEIRMQLCKAKHSHTKGRHPSVNVPGFYSCRLQRQSATSPTPVCNLHNASVKISQHTHYAHIISTRTGWRNPNHTDWALPHVPHTQTQVTMFVNAPASCKHAQRQQCSRPITQGDQA